MLKLAVIGAGAIGQIHARNIAGTDAAELACICDLDLYRARSLTDKFGGLPVADIDAALGLAIDAVIVASATASHGDVIQQCIAARKPFLCEKPLASDLETARAIVDATKSAGLVAGTAFNRRFDAAYRGMRDEVAAGNIGPVETISIVSRTASPPTPEFLRTSGGLFGEKGSHFYDLARWIIGEEPEEVFAFGSVLVNPVFADIGEVDTAVVSLRFPSGALCQLNFSWRAAYGQDERLEVHCARGMMQNQQFPTGPFQRFDGTGMAHEGKMPGWLERFEPTYRRELDAFCKAIETGEQGDLPTLADGLAVQHIADAARASQQNGQPIKLNAK